MKAIANPFSVYRQAHGLLWKHAFWKYLLWPIVISFGLTVVLVCSYLALGDWLVSSIERHFFGEEQLPNWLKYLFWAYLLFQFCGPLYVAFRSLVMVCYGPFLDRLSEKIETEINVEARQTKRTFVESIKRPVLMFFWTLGASLAVLFAGIGMGFIPLLGFMLAGALQIPVQIFLSGVSYIDPYLDRSGYSPKESFGVMRQHFGGTIVFATIGLLIQAIPIVGWFVGPTYSVVAGVLYAMRLEQESPRPKP